MSIDDADDILQDDIQEISSLIAYYNKTKEFKALLPIAQKCNALADLYYEALEGVNERFFEYKELSSQFYEEISRISPSSEIRLNSKLLSILLLLQSKKKVEATKRLKNLRAKGKAKSNVEIKEEWLYIIELMLIPSLKEAKRNLKHSKSGMDNNLYKFFEKTLEILQELDQ